MYSKLIILVALTSCMLVAAQSGNNTESTNTTQSDNSTETTNATQSDNGTESTDATQLNNSTESSNNTEATTTPTVTSTTTQLPPIPTRPNNRPSPPHGPPPRGPPPRGPPPRGPPPRRPPGIPGFPIISGIINTVDNILNSLRGPGNRPGGRRFRRYISAQASINSSIFPSLPNFPSIPNISDLPIPNVDDFVPDIPELSDPSNLQIPEIPNLPSLPLIPGLQDAVDEARERVANEISPGEDLASGIENAIQNGLSSLNPTEAMRGLVSTILKAYLVVALHCPLLIVGRYVLREGLFLTSTILAIMADVTAQIQDRV